MERFNLYCGDSLEVLRGMPENSVDAVVSDPPYGLGREPDALDMLRDWMTTGHHDVGGAGFMGKKWDAFVPQPALWAEVFRVLKPGGHLLAFFGSRTYDVGTLAIRLAGFEIRDQVMWIYGSGFPKSLDVSKAIDNKLGCADQREVTHYKRQGTASMFDGGKPRPASLPASQWAGWGTALKPAHEPICVARKPLQGTVAENVLRWGTGAVNVDGGRIATDEAWAGRELPNAADGVTWGGALNSSSSSSHPEGRWPANIIHDGSDEATAAFPQEMGESAARFFYCAKASKEDRDEGIETEAKRGTMMTEMLTGSGNVRNHHPTVKPTDLMRYLCRLVTPPNGVILDPFMGSGSTGKAAMLEGFRFIGIDITPEYIEIARARIQHAHDTRHNVGEIIKKESAKVGQLSIFDVLPAADVPQQAAE